ncbi:MAG TPA: DUF4231 domain-containing protein [Ktedonobacteraceae bacterium]|nr:DUF4231 domain-containing protein [Ktedonobacteraceae bacterium]
MSSLETVKNEELNSVHYSFDRAARAEEIYVFEAQQINLANQAIAKNNEEKQKALEKEREEQKKTLAEEQERLKSLTPEQKLYLEREAFFKKEVPQIIDEYKKESRQYRNFHNRLQWTIIIGSAIVTSATSATIFTNFVTVSYVLKGISALCSLFVTIAASVMGYFKYRERSNNLQKAADDIENDYEAVKLGTHVYLDKTREEAMGIFADRILKRIKEQKEEQQILEQPPDVKQLPANQ